MTEADRRELASDIDIAMHEVVTAYEPAFDPEGHVARHLMKALVFMEIALEKAKKTDEPAAGGGS